MTYIVGWRFGSTAYFASDTAVTVVGPLSESPPEESQGAKTSFGESNVSEPLRAVSEGALKLINLGRAAVAMCGDIPLARSVTTSLARRLEDGDDPQQALRNAVADNGPFSDHQRQIHLIVGIPQFPTPKLFAFNIDGDQKIHEVPDCTLVQFGSMEAKYKSVTAQMISKLKIFANEPDQFLIAGLAFLQSYGIHDHLLEHGVGGAFCGLHVGTETIQWQKDVLYFVHTSRDRPSDPTAPDCGEMVSSIVRDHVLVVRSTFSHRCSYFGDSVNRGLNDEWKAKWWDNTFEFISHGRFDFVVALNTRDRIISVVEMMKNLSSRHLRIEPGSPQSEGFRLQVVYSPDLSKCMREPCPDRHDGTLPIRFNWFPFEEPDQSAEQPVAAKSSGRTE